MREAHRKNYHGGPYEGLTVMTKNGAMWTGDLKAVPDALDLPQKRGKPTVFFVNSMSDLFHERLPESYIRYVFKVMNECPQHIFQTLTKRPERMLDLSPRLTWTPNIWGGTSIGYAKTAHRAELLASTGAHLKWLSLEPLIGPIPNLPLNGIHWAVIGGESGPGARPMDLEWVREIMTQCCDAGVPVFVKQLGAVRVREFVKQHREWPKKRASGRGKWKRDVKGAVMEAWPEDLRIREFPAAVPAGATKAAVAYEADVEVEGERA